MKKLIVIDMQYDFVDGTLANPLAKEIVPDLAEYIKNFDGEIIFTRDTHDKGYLLSYEGRKLPVKHCIYGTHGWDVLDELVNAAENKKTAFIDKLTFGYTGWEDFVSNGDDITLTGTCTDICIISNALILRAKCPNSDIHVKSKLCAGLTKELQEAALNVMKSCQCEIE